MITSKRDLKKHIHRIGDEVVKTVVPAAVCSGLLSESQAADILEKLAQLTQEAVDRISISFDKKPDAFDSMTAYKKARTNYFKEAYGKALLDYEQSVNKLISPIGKDEAAK